MSVSNMEERQGVAAFRASKYWGPVKILGGWTIGVLVFGWLFPILIEPLLSESARDSVLVQAIPFVTRFIALILLFVLLIFIVALRYNSKIPYRTYRPIELIIMAGIVVGVVCLFQPWHIVSYEYGFLLLLASTLLFILWSHVVPQHKRAAIKPPPFKPIHHAIGAVLALIVLGLLAYNLTVSAKPEAPYGYTERQWNRGLREEQRQEIIEEEESTYENFSVPFFVFLSLFPAAVVYFIAREVSVGLVGDDRTVGSPPVMAEAEI
jgi:hypothetical protein